MGKVDRKYCEALDQQDDLAFLRKEFYLAEGVINMDGNSLGALPRKTMARLSNVMEKEWGQGLIRSWADAGWFEAPVRIGNKIAKLIGAGKGEVLVADSTSVNLFKALSAAVRLNQGRPIILSDDSNFPTDLYMMQGLASFCGDSLKVKVVRPEQILNALSDEVAVLSLTQVDFKSARIKNMELITKKAHEKGVLVVWDLSHSVGSIEVDLNGAAVDFAVGCGYKFLNGGPGAPAFIFTAYRHQSAAEPILSGWMGHQDPFAFSLDYRPAPGIERFRCGTPGVLGMAALEIGVDLFEKTKMSELRKKSVRLSRLFIELMEQECGDYGFRLYSPLNDKERAGHVAFGHDEGLGIYRAIKARQIISDFRPPNVLRFGITPMYQCYQDIFEVVRAIREVMETRAWDKPEYKIRGAIT